MQGLRGQETDKFIRFFNIVQNTAKQRKCVFFTDAGDGREFETDILEGEDLMGWLIPESKLSEFEKEWKSGDVSDDWSDFFCWAVYDNTDDPVISFENL